MSGNSNRATKIHRKRKLKYSIILLMIILQPTDRCAVAD